MIHRTKLLIGFSVIGLALVAGAGWWFFARSQPPPSSPAGQITTVGSGSAAFFRWKEGPAVMICVDIPGGQMSTGESLSGPPWVRKDQGYFAVSAEGRRLDWRFETTDVKTVKCWLNDKEYDLAKGNVFLVKTKGGKTEVEQVSRDLSAVQPVVKSCKDFAQKDPAVSTLLGLGD
jgi:hypothetical protein